MTHSLCLLIQVELSRIYLRESSQETRKCHFNDASSTSLSSPPSAVFPRWRSKRLSGREGAYRLFQSLILHWNSGHTLSSAGMDDYVLCLRKKTCTVLWWMGHEWLAWVLSRAIRQGTVENVQVGSVWIRQLEGKEDRGISKPSCNSAGRGEQRGGNRATFLI